VTGTRTGGIKAFLVLTGKFSIIWYQYSYDHGEFRREVVHHKQGGAAHRGAVAVRREDSLM
jgi:hypothetical protein